MKFKGKIINDPVYGFIRIADPLILEIINHPWFQRLRQIKQMGLAHLVYPGATHTRFHHSIGAYHLMTYALNNLTSKGFELTNAERLGAQLAILLHDIGHGPFSHSLENTLAKEMNHEALSLFIMEQINVETGGKLEVAIAIFKNEYPKKWLHQLVSSQLDVDRLDYLNRDSFYSGVSEGIIGYDRILQMLSLHENKIVVEEKAIQSVEKMIIARRMMYWQVYLHKTVFGAELLLINILKRAQQIVQTGTILFAAPALQFFLKQSIQAIHFQNDLEALHNYCQLDDNDIMSAIKVWQFQPDIVLSTLCKMLIQRKLYKIIISSENQEEIYENAVQKISEKFNFDNADSAYFWGQTVTDNRAYNPDEESISVLMKNGEIKNISEIDHALVTAALSIPISKNVFYYSEYLISS